MVYELPRRRSIGIEVYRPSNEGFRSASDPSKLLEASAAGQLAKLTAAPVALLDRMRDDTAVATSRINCLKSLRDAILAYARLGGRWVSGWLWEIEW